MRKTLLFCMLMVVVSAASAGYEDVIMKPWIGATQDELTSKWGYPQSANDYVKISDEITIFTYRSNRLQVRCVISFTVKNKTVIGWKYEGGNCPRHKR